MVINMLLAMTQDFVREILDSEGGRIYFPNSGLFPNGFKIDNVIFTIPGIGLEIYWYGFLIAMGMVLAMLYTYKNARRFGIEPNRFTDTVLAGFIGGIIGARAYYVIFRLDNYLTDDGTFDLMAALKVRDGGLAIYGGVIGALLFGVVMAKIRKVNLPAILDLTGMGFLIGQCLGRWGNFFNQEAFGAKTTLPWGMTSKKIINDLYAFYWPDNVSIVTNRATEMIAHPCFFYESMWCLIGFIALHFYKKHRKFDGELFLLYIGWYGLGRFWIEALRTDSLYLINNDAMKLKVSQLVAGTCVLFALVILAYMYIQLFAKKKPYTFYKDTEESAELLRLYDKSILDNERRKGKHADDALDVRILADEDGEDATQAEPTESGASTEIEEEKPSVGEAPSENQDTD